VNRPAVALPQNQKLRLQVQLLSRLEAAVLEPYSLTVILGQTALTAFLVLLRQQAAAVAAFFLLLVLQILEEAAAVAVAVNPVQLAPQTMVTQAVMVERRPAVVAVVLVELVVLAVALRQRLTAAPTYQAQ